MPWHRLGTVSVTLNSSTVTGVGTGFVANARIGDAFIGPDGRQYELGNIASDTVISIIPAYQGSTVSGAAYAIAPIQGYQKGLADQVRGWVNSYGPAMAALGNGSTHNVQSSSHDSTASALLMPGAFGWGMDGSVLPTVTDANGFRPAGLYFAKSGALNVPLTGDALLEVRNLSGQVLYETITYYATRRKFERVFVTTTWSVWDEVLTSSSFAGVFSGGAIGSYSFLKNVSGGTIPINSVAAASYLSYSDTSNTSFGTPSGAWRAMSAVANGYSSLFLRLN